MPPKRKNVGVTSNRPSKRVASGAGTPVAAGSDSDEYTEGGEEASETEAENLKSTRPICDLCRMSLIASRGSFKILNRVVSWEAQS